MAVKLNLTIFNRLSNINVGNVRYCRSSIDKFVHLRTFTFVALILLGKAILTAHENVFFRD